MTAQELDLVRDTQSFSAAGMPVILRTTSPDPDISGEIVSFQISAFGGASLSNKAGVLSMMTQVMTKGTYRYSKEQIDEIFSKAGASFGISAGEQSVQVSLKCLKRFLPTLLPIISEIIRVPLFDEKEISLAKDQTINDLKNEKDHPDGLLSLEMFKAFYQGHPYLNRPAGYLESIPKIQRGDLSDTLRKTFNKNNLLIVVVGELQKEEAVRLIETYFASIPEGVRASEITEQPNNDTSKIHYVKFDAPTTYFMATFKAPPLESPDYPAISIAMQILDDRLFEEVRTKRSLTYSVHASVGNSKINKGNFYVTSTQLPKAVEVMFEEAKKLQVEEISESLIKQQVTKFLSSWYLSRETRSSQAQIFAAYEILGVGWEKSNSFIDRLRSVTAADIQRVMRTYLKDFTFATVGPEEPELAPILNRLGFFKPGEQLKKEAPPEGAAEPESKPEVTPEAK